MESNLNHSYVSHQPQFNMYTFAQTGEAPYQCKQFALPEIFQYKPNPTSEEQKFLLKVTTTPINVPNNEEPVYTVETTSGKKLSTLKNASDLTVGHIVPLKNTELAVSALNPLKQTANDVKSPGHLNDDNENIASYNMEENKERAFVKIYQGTTATNPYHIIKNSQNTVLSSQLLKRLPDYEKESLACQINLEDGEEKHYAWITPLGDAKIEQPMEEEDIEINSSKDILGKSTGVHVYKLFHQASRELSESFRNNTDQETKKQIIYNKIDDELGLPSELRPSVIVQENKFGNPVFAGQKEPCNFQLHAIEVHQYLPMPGQDNPWVLENHVNPSTTAIFGPMPMPFDPVNSGMVAPIFHNTKYQIIPQLCPNLANMFSQRIPSVQPIN